MTGRPRNFDRDAALDCALNAFWRDGYAATSVAALTEAMDIRPPSLYAAFGDKEQLFAEASQAYIDRLRAAMDAALDASTARAGLVELLRVTARAHTDPQTPPGCLMLSEARLAGERARMREVIAARVGRGQQEGDVAGGVDPAAVAAFVEAVLSGMSGRARDGGDLAAVTAIVDVAIAALPGD